MTESKKGLQRDWPATETEWDSHVDPDDIPEQTRADFARGVIHRNGVPVESVALKQRVTLRLDADIIAYYRNTGEGWQDRVNQVLRKAARDSRGD